MLWRLPKLSIVCGGELVSLRRMCRMYPRSRSAFVRLDTAEFRMWMVHPLFMSCVAIFALCWCCGHFFGSGYQIAGANSNSLALSAETVQRDRLRHGRQRLGAFSHDHSRCVRSSEHEPKASPRSLMQCSDGDLYLISSFLTPQDRFALSNSW